MSRARLEWLPAAILDSPQAPEPKAKSREPSVKNDFHQFVRDEFGELMVGRGFRRKGGSFERHQQGVMTIAIFMRYHEPLRPLFNVRLQVALDAFTHELGAILSRDLSNLMGLGSRAKEWRWPVSGPEREHLSSELKDALQSHALPWLER